VAVVDPIVTTAYVTRNHAYLIYDTLYGIDDDFKPSRRWPRATRSKMGDGGFR
jgi:peptide/nickel transport system substrate-binding protein